MTSETIQEIRLAVNDLLLKRYGIDLTDVDEERVDLEIRDGEEAEAIVDGLAEDYDLEELPTS